MIAGMIEYISGDGKDDLLESFESAFDGIIEGAKTWGSDIIGNLIDGIGEMVGKLRDKVSSVADTIADYLHFSVPEKGSLSDFDESGGDMIQSFIDSMMKQRRALQEAVNDTAGIIGTGLENSYDITAQAMVNRTTDYGSGLSRIEQAMTAPASSQNGTMIFPIYIGQELLDTVIVDAIDRNNYTSGGY